MAATALVATADGEVTFSELSALDSVLESVQDLQIYDPHDAVDIYRRYADGIGQDQEGGTRDALHTVSRIANDREASDLVIRVAVAISKADGEFSEPEWRVVEQICETLDLPIPSERSDPTPPGDPER